MIQLKLPLVYEKVHLVDKTKKHQLPLRWKVVFVLLLIYSIALSTITYVRANQPQTETVQVPAGAARVKMTATVPGWYDVTEIDNVNLLLKTNMKVWVNGREFIRCSDCGQRTNPSLLDF